MKPNKKNSIDNIEILINYLTQFDEYLAIFKPFSHSRSG
ncbi:hypothetical protein M917_2174 [Psychrobacter aquaticus CMS 56]|uniref:Uncharacterized protein n=1 Tax=Psychrobacter aquaticus CMS 56 TaxID=1354303 RepID=U4T8M0_9GAMM|nr:hypothetical protein M917_2174 [Psychrobacter aquaticus CMS 56]